MIYNTFEQAFINLNKEIFRNPTQICNSRNGKMYEKFGLSYQVTDPSSYEFTNKKLGRIDYEYAKHFYEWMINGCSDKATEEFAKKYSNVSKFLEKPKSNNLPDNFNVFYGPRILRQLPTILEELNSQENSRRAVINILNESDQKLFKAKEDSNLEYPCADSSTLSIRDGKLHQHLHMRSNNMGNVAKLDMYLWGKFQCEIAKQLNVEVGTFYCSIVSAHIFESDFDYFFSIGLFDSFNTKKKYLKLKLDKLKDNKNQLTFIRHQQTEANRDRILQGSTNTSLVKTPDEDVKLNLLKSKIYFNNNIDKVVYHTSELGRSKDTLNLILKSNSYKNDDTNIIIGMVPIEDKKLKPKAYNFEVKSSVYLNEICWGNYEKSQNPENYKELDNLLVWYYEHNHITHTLFLEKSSENFSQVIDRFIIFVNSLLDSKDTHHIVVGHGLYIQLIYFIITGKVSNRIGHLEHVQIIK